MKSGLIEINNYFVRSKADEAGVYLSSNTIDEDWI